MSQPFQLVARVEGAARRHVPDFVAVREDGLVTVVDVKPRRRLADEKVAFTFAWTGQVATAHGWAFEVFSEPDGHAPRRVLA
ncbi:MULTISPECIES: TnsA endonuclease N-terminal domain-containing protein [Pseudofrankia]|uniref:TnsA endonuclease N-terminal domain-containing protein n=1 Tax=Pseudofrankia TaxID=2994363 RepID=UPI00031811F2|nr:MULTISPECIES: TnsA endonuclease N-terminal domain-containing protein [Pseudofrankia]